MLDTYIGFAVVLTIGWIVGLCFAVGNWSMDRSSGTYSKQKIAQDARMVMLVAASIFAVALWPLALPVAVVYFGSKIVQNLIHDYKGE